MTCIEHGVAVIHADLGEGLNSFPDDSVDAVVCEQTLQTLVRPVDMLREMLRVGREALASFPNFGYWRIRLDLALRGRMPSSKGLHRWYDTPNIHPLPSPISKTGFNNTATSLTPVGYWSKAQ